MAYADWDFYTANCKPVIPEADFPRLAERASREVIDKITFRRLRGRFPEDEYDAYDVHMAACAVAEKMYLLELADAQARSAAAAGGASGTEGGAAGGMAVSRSSGSESVSYASPAQLAGGAKEWSAVYAAAGDAGKEGKLLRDTARRYLEGIRTEEGVPLLYAGRGCIGR